MDTPLILNLVRGRLDDIDALKQALETQFGETPAINLRMEIMLGGERLIISADDQQVVVRDGKRNEIVTQGAPDLARYAIKGMDQSD